MKQKPLTIAEFMKENFSFSPAADGTLFRLLRDISSAATAIYAGIGKAGLANMLGDTGAINPHGERVQALDVFADQQLTQRLRAGRNCAGIASEEKEDILVFDEEGANQSPYVVMFDPLDGSGNINANISVGTIFGIYKRKSRHGKPCDSSDFLQPGNRQVAAGYVLYGCSAVLVYATRRGVNGFTLDPDTGEFSLSHPLMRCPEMGSILAFNQGYFFQYSPEIQQYILSCQQPAEGQGHFTQRYAGSMVADVHRILLSGGVFLYPGTREKPNGKLRLLYECNPLAFIMDVAGGRATDGLQRILDIEPAGIHQVTPVYMGSADRMEKLVQSPGSSCAVKS